MFLLEHGKNSTYIISVARVLFEGSKIIELTLVPMILVEIFRAIGKCKRWEANFFERFNLHLQMWAMEYFHKCK